MKLIYVASPYAGDVERNVEYAKQACRTVMESGHAFLPPFAVSGCSERRGTGGAAGGH